MAEMIEQIRCDSLQVIKSVLKELKKGNFASIRESSDHIIHCASIYQDVNSIRLSVSVYALSKMLERNKEITPLLFEQLELLNTLLSKRDYEGYGTELKKLLEMLSKEDNKLQKYIRRVVNDAQIKKGFKIYEHGISLGKTAELLGISQWELMKYIGGVKLSDTVKDKIQLQHRLNYARELFNVQM